MNPIAHQTNEDTNGDNTKTTLNQIDQLIHNYTTIWRASSRSKNHQKHRLFETTDVLPTAYPELDKRLHYGGWPRNAMTEIGLPLSQGNLRSGIGEMRLLLPALRHILKQHYAIWIAPPFLPYTPALLEAKINTERLIIVDAKTPQDRLWSAEQAIKSGAIKAVFTWLNNDKQTIAALRRLQLATKQNKCWTVLFRNQNELRNASPAALRIKINSHRHSKLNLEVIKQPGGWAGQTLDLSLAPHYENWQRLPSSLLPTYTQSTHPLLTDPDGFSIAQNKQANVTPLNNKAQKLQAKTRLA